MTKSEYNSVENYTSLFADILADVEPDYPNTADNIVAGFKQAVADWIRYHQDQLTEFKGINEEI